MSEAYGSGLVQSSDSGDALLTEEEPTYHRWFILPVHEYDEGYAPRYVSEDEQLSGFSSGGPFTRQQVEDAGYHHLLSYNDADNWRVTVAWGDGDDAWNALNEIHANYHDTETLADHGQDVKPIMDDRFGENNWSVNAVSLQESENTG